LLLDPAMLDDKTVGSLSLREDRTLFATSANNTQHVALEGDPDEGLTRDAHDRLCKRLEANGSKLSPAHRQALLEVVSGFTRQALGSTPSRLAYPMPTGTGKTLAIAAWCAAVSARKMLGQQVSVAISAMRVEALIELRASVISFGVDANDIGLMHSLKHDRAVANEAVRRGQALPDGYASGPADDDARDKPILLATHARIKGQVVEAFNRYQDAPRSLLIWDESLLRSEASFIELGDLSFALDALKTRLPKDGVTLRWLSGVIPMLRSEQGRLDAGGQPRVLPISPPTILDGDIKGELRGLRDSLLRPRQREIVSDLTRLVDLAANPLTMLRDGLISYAVTVPNELANIAILDASFPVRRLCSLDSSIGLGLRSVGDIKRFDDVVVNFVRAGAGRSSLEASIESGTSGFVGFVLEAIGEMAASESAIIFTFKARPGETDFIEAIRSAMRNEAIDPDELIGGRRRFNFLTWGNETSLNSLKHCQHVIFAGVLHRSPLDLAASAAGQADDLLLDPSSADTAELLISELTHSLYQAMSRGSCRDTVDGRAGAMTAWLFMRDERARTSLERIMPGLQWRTFKSANLGTATRTEELADKVHQTLASLSVPMTTSNWLVKQLPELTGAGKEMKAEAIRRGAELAGWTRKKQRLVRAVSRPSPLRITGNSVPPPLVHLTQ
jgi:hypothetical protein